jgi:hypothetical protein
MLKLIYDKRMRVNDHMKYVSDWDMVKERFIAWWNRSKIDRPLMKVVARRKNIVTGLEAGEPANTPEEYYLDVEKRIKRVKDFYRTHILLADAYPSFSQDIGPGSMAAYLGSQPVFSWDTVWFTEYRDSSWNISDPLEYNPKNYWWKRHLELLRRARELAGEDFFVNIPDIVENIDILSALRGPQNLCYDLMDSPDLVKKLIKTIDELYFVYYDQIYDLIRNKDGGSSYTAFNIWGPGKVAAVQCDFSAMLSPAQFREFILPSLQNQCQKLDFSLYHLDGTAAVKHLDALMEIDELDALQWTPDACTPDAANERWYPICEKVRSAGKSLWIDIYDGGIKNWIDSADRFVKHFGADGLYFHFPVMEQEDAEELMDKALRDWRV